MKTCNSYNCSIWVVGWDGMSIPTLLVCNWISVFLGNLLGWGWSSHSPHVEADQPHQTSFLFLRLIRNAEVIELHAAAGIMISPESERLRKIVWEGSRESGSWEEKSCLLSKTAASASCLQSNPKSFLPPRFNYPSADSNAQPVLAVQHFSALQTKKKLERGFARLCPANLAS